MHKHIVCLLMLLWLVACGTTQRSAPPAPAGGITPVIAPVSKVLDGGNSAVPKAGEPAPDFQFTLEDGTTMKLSDLRGKKVIINFWATWCVPCRTEMPDLQKISREYSDSVAVVGVNTLEYIDKIKPFAEELQVSFPLIADPQGAIRDRYGVRVMPTTYFVNSDGTINAVTEKNAETGEAVQTDVKIGPMSYAFIKQQLDHLK